MLLVVDSDGKVRIYENINDTFTLFQTLTPLSGLSLTTGAITDDHEWVVFATIYSPSEI